MNKLFKIILGLTIAAFIGVNAILLFGEKSVLPKRLYVHDYTEAYTGTYSRTMAKAALTVPTSETVITAPGGGTIEKWLVEEGDAVELGTELAVLDAVEAEEQRAIWETELTALKNEQEEVEDALSDLKDELDDQNSSTTESTTTQVPGINNNDDDDTSGSNTSSDSNGEVNVDINIEVPQQGAYAAGIAQLEQQLAAIGREIEVIEAQLDKAVTQAALLSQVNGTVAEVAADSITIYSKDRSFRTYVTEEQRLEVATGEKAYIQAPGLETPLPAIIREVAEVPAGSDEWFHAYRVLETETPDNPLAFYAVDFEVVPEFEAIIPNAEQEPAEGTAGEGTAPSAEEPAAEEAIDPLMAAAGLPFGGSAHAAIIIDEAAEAVALPESWIFNRDKDEGYAFALTPEGYAIPVPVTVNFDLYNRVVLANGIPPETVVLNEEKIAAYKQAPIVFMPMPMELPDWQQVEDMNWREYVPYLFGR